MTGALDREHRHRLNELDMVVPDGMPVRWGLNLLYHCQLPDRVYGPNLMLNLCDVAAEKQLPIYLFGTDQSTLDALTANLKTKFPAILIAGSEPSQFRRLSETESQALVQRIRSSGAKMVFVGLGCPRQEIWAYEMGDLLRMPIFAVGAAFAFHAGTLPQAPSWMQRSGLEWLFRLWSEPKRLWKRYVYLNPAFVFLLAMQWFRIRSFDPKDDPKPPKRMLYG
jgi:exopolysaccharide biosynthesis WecB/TagA/CpsF family protein